MLSISVVENEFRREPESRSSVDLVACGVLDGCSRARNQARPKNFVMH
jgi:hypothetical protein